MKSMFHHSALYQTSYFLQPYILLCIILRIFPTGASFLYDVTFKSITMYNVTEKCYTNDLVTTETDETVITF